MLSATLGGGVVVSERQAELLYGHYRLLERWRRVVNLAKFGDWREAVRRHYAESLFLARQLPEGRLRILDVGSGAGFPGIGIAAARTDCEVVLAEARHRKAAFLREATRDWANVCVYFGRAEELAGPFDWVVARAVRPEVAVRVAALVGSRVGLLTRVGAVRGVGNQVKAGAKKVVRWGAPIAVPWAQGRAVVLGEILPGP